MFNSSVKNTLVHKYGKAQHDGYPNSKHFIDHGRDFQLLADHMTKLRNFTKGGIGEFSAFHFHYN